MKTVLGFLVLALTGCASPPPAPSAADAEAAAVPLECQGKQQCDDWWRRAQIWVATNSRMKIQLATDALIETYNITDYTPVYSYRVLRMPLANGAERIDVSMSCGNPLGCHESGATIRARFNHFVRGNQ